MTLFVLLFMIITTYAYIFSIPSYGWIRIRIFFLIRIRNHQKVSDPQHWLQLQLLLHQNDAALAQQRCLETFKNPILL
jgi:hypothetical protein